jgi:hypothetical protein
MQTSRGAEAAVLSLLLAVGLVLYIYGLNVQSHFMERWGVSLIVVIAAQRVGDAVRRWSAERWG